MDVVLVALILHVALFGDENELSVVPIVDNHTVRLPLHQVAGESIVKTRNEQRRDSPDGGQPVLEDVVENHVVERQNVL